MGEDVGVFIHFHDTDVELVIRGCKEVLDSVDGNNNAVITGIMRDRNYDGFRVYFNEESVIEDFLKLKFLPLSDERASIHCLTTKLTVHDVMPDSEEDFKRILRDQMEDFDLKPILDICSIPVSPDYPSIRSGNWLLELDIPEIEDLDVFRNSGLPYNMKISISIKAVKREKRVSFFCSLCHDIEHSREQCHELIYSPQEENGCARTSPDAYINPSQSEMRSASSVPSGASKSTSKSAKRIRIESIVGNLQKQNSVKPSPVYSVKIKQEPEDTDKYPGLLYPRVVLKRAKIKTENDHDCSTKKMRMEDNQDDERCSPPVATSSTTGRDSPVIVYESPRRSSSTDDRILAEDSTVSYDTDYSCQEDSNAPIFNLPTSSQQETSSDPLYNSDLLPTEETDFTDSVNANRTPRSTRKKPVYAPVVLPKRIKQIVQSREKKTGELTVSELEAFFNHVKKKMSPAKVAKQFTDDVVVLKDQLKWIVQQYYMTPKAGSGEDSRFMKWLEGMMERFDSIPSKRKKIKTEPED